MVLQNRKKNRPIGIFDSGLGGLTVVKQIRRFLPNEDIVYFGDTARVPYGTKSKETVIRFSAENIKFLMKFGVKLIVVACNTSSSLALESLKKKFRLPILGVIKPGAEEAVRRSRNKKIAVIGTTATIKSNAYPREIKSIYPRSKIFAKNCPLFVPLVEEGWLDGAVTGKVIKTYLGFLKGKNIDTLILGCTHYPLLRRPIGKFLGKDVHIVDSAAQIAKETKTALEKNNLLSDKKKGKIKFFVSDEPERFKKVGRRFLGSEIKSVKRI